VLPLELELPLGEVVPELPELGLLLPVVSVLPVDGVVLGELGVVLEPLRGVVSPRRPAGEVLSVLPGDWLVLVRLPVSLPPPLFLQAPTPTISAAADAKAMIVRTMMILL